MNQRPRGTGSIEFRSGKWWPRLPRKLGGKRLDPCETEHQALDALAAALLDIGDDPPAPRVVNDWAKQAFEDRERSGHYKGVDEERRVWARYVERKPLGLLDLSDVTPKDARRWLRGLKGKSGKPLGGQTLQNALTVVRAVFRAAVDEELIPSNPFADVRLPKGAHASDKDGWTYLEPDEIDKVLALTAIAPFERMSAVVVAIFSGLRAGELWGLRWSDVNFDRGVLHVRRNRDKPTKAGQTREVAMLAPVRETLLAWRSEYQRRNVRSLSGLVWPAKDGRCHSEGYDAGWATYKPRKKQVVLGLSTRAGITRHVRFHDLRHTCASHLLQGTWAPELLREPLRLEEVRDWLGHSDIQVTQRYSHLCADGIRAKVVPNRPQVVPATPKNAAKAGLRPRFPKPWVKGSNPFGSAGFSGLGDEVGDELRKLAVAYLEAVARGDKHRDRYGQDLAARVVELLTADTAGERAGGTVD